MDKDVIGQGRGRLALVVPGVPVEDWQFSGHFSSNLRLYEGATILAQLVRRDPAGRSWHLGIAYVEFENNGGDPVVTPVPERDEGKSYFDGLAGHPTRDYLRVPVIHTKLESGSDEYPGGNIVTFYAHTAGSEGVHGKQFSAGQQSRVYGVALVASPQPADPAQDLVYSRLYYAANDQQTKPASAQIALQYQIPFA